MSDIDGSTISKYQEQIGSDEQNKTTTKLLLWSIDISVFRNNIIFEMLRESVIFPFSKIGQFWPRLDPYHQYSI